VGMSAEYVSFELSSDERLERLAAFIHALATAKVEDDFHDDAYWEGFLDERSRTAFWWPTAAEAKEWKDRWYSTPIDRRWTEPSLRTRWVFGSLVDAAEHGEFEHLKFRRMDGGGAIEFEPCAWPFGGTAWMHAAIEAFGGRVIDDTTTGR